MRLRMTQQQPSLSKWLFAFLAAIPIAGLTIYYCIGHLALNIPLSSLVQPFLIQSFLTMVLAPFMHRSKRHELESGGDLRPLFACASAYAVAVCMMYEYYLRKFSRVSITGLWQSYFLILIVGVIGGVGGFYLHRSIFRQR